MAKLQIAAGAKGITCQKLGEAEVMAAAGFDDILISYNLIGEEKMGRLGALQAQANMPVAADNSLWSQACPRPHEISGRPLDRWWWSATRAASAPASRRPAEAIALASEIAGSTGLSFAGFMLYPPETGWPTSRSSSTTRSRASEKAGSTPRWSLPAARRT